MNQRIPARSSPGFAVLNPAYASSSRPGAKLRLPPGFDGIDYRRKKRYLNRTPEITTRVDWRKRVKKAGRVLSLVAAGMLPAVLWAQEPDPLDEILVADEPPAESRPAAENEPAGAEGTETSKAPEADNQTSAADSKPAESPETVPTIPVASAENEGPGKSPPPPRTGRVIEEVVVTARKTEESIQDVPVAVTALSADELEKSSSFGTQDIQYRSPNITIREGGAQGTAAIFQIRGQVQNDTIGTLDPSVGFYSDGVYVARAFGSNVAFVDVANIQVLRGPQGTLFGRNTTGGAILLSTRDPDLDGVSGFIETGMGRFGQRQIDGAVNLPLLDDLLAVRVAGHRLKRDGYGEDRSNDREIATDDNSLLRLKVLFQPMEDLRFLLAGERIDIDRIGNPVQPAFALKPTEANDPVGCCLAFFLAPDYDSYVGGDPYQVDYDPGLVPFSRVEVRSLTLTATWDLPLATVKLIGGQRENMPGGGNRIDIDATPHLIVDTTQANQNKQDSYELQFTGNWFDERLKWAAGVYDFSEDGRDDQTTTAFAPGIVIITRSAIVNKSQGAYVEGNYRLTDRLGLTAGVRYSTDDRSMVLRATLAGRCQVPQSMRDDPSPTGECVGSFQKDYRNTSYRLGADYRLFEGSEFFDETLAYFSYATGYRAGGFNVRGVSEETLQPFDPEELAQIEVGIKADFLDRRMRANLALFDADFENIQRTGIIAINGVPATVVANAAQASIRGLELELTALPFDSLEFGASLGLIDARYDKFIDPGDGRDRTDEKFDEVPDMTYNLSATHTSAIFGSEWINRVDYAWQDEVPSQQGAADYFRSQGHDTRELQTRPAQGYLNARSGLALDNGLEIAVYGKNLTDRQQYSTLPLGNGPDFITRFYTGSPREFGLQLKYRF